MLLLLHHNIFGILHRGYTAPEYAIYGQLSEKVDTYSYGVVLLEIISGRKSSETMQDFTGEYLLKKLISIKPTCSFYVILIFVGNNSKREQANL